MQTWGGGYLIVYSDFLIFLNPNGMKGVFNTEGEGGCCILRI